MINTLLKLDEDENLVINEESSILLLPEFSALWSLKFNKADKDMDGRKRYYGRKILKYIYLTLHYNSPLSDYNEDTIIKESLTATGLTNKDVTKLPVKAAIEKFTELLNSYKQIQLLNANKNMINKAITHIDGVDFDSVDKNGKTIYDITKYMKLPGELDSVLRKFKEVEKAVKKSLADKIEVRGDAELGMFED